MKQRILMITCAALIVAAGLSLTSSADASRVFTNRDLRGNYGFLFSGEAVDGPFVGPISGLGQIHFDGRGNAVATRTLNLTGTLVLEQEAVGTYQVAPNGTSRATFTVRTIEPPGFPDAEESFVAVIEIGRRLQFMATGPGVVASGIGYGQPRRHGDDD